MKALVIMSCLLLSIKLRAEDPRSYDLCILVIEGKGEAIKNIKGEDVVKIVEYSNAVRKPIHGVNTSTNYIILDKVGQQRFLDIHDDKISYQIHVIGDHYAFYKIPVKDFTAYISGNGKWDFTPSHFLNKKSGEALKLVPLDK